VKVAVPSLSEQPVDVLSSETTTVSPEVAVGFGV
jgi:hypothetical protein